MQRELYAKLTMSVVDAEEFTKAKIIAGIVSPLFDLGVSVDDVNLDCERGLVSTLKIKDRTVALQRSSLAQIYLDVTELTTSLIRSMYFTS